MLQLLIAGAFALAIQNNSAALPAIHLPHAISVSSGQKTTFLSQLSFLQAQATGSGIIKKHEGKKIASISPEEPEAGSFATPITTRSPVQGISLTPTPSYFPIPNSTPSLISPTQPSSFDPVYQSAGAQFGVPWQILYGIHLTESGCRDGHIMSGYGSGARGPMQFMPGTFAAYQVPGHPNIDNAVDSIYAAANFIAKHGSVSAALASYGGNNAGVLAAARARGYNQL